MGSSPDKSHWWC